ATLAGWALPASQPRIDDAGNPRPHRLSVGADLYHLSTNLVAHRQGERDAAILEGHLVARAQIVDALPDVDVAVAHAGTGHSDEDLGAFRLGSRAVQAL